MADSETLATFGFVAISFKAAILTFSNMPLRFIRLGDERICNRHRIGQGKELIFGLLQDDELANRSPQDGGSSLDHGDAHQTISPGMSRNNEAQWPLTGRCHLVLDKHDVVYQD